MVPLGSKLPKKKTFQANQQRNQLSFETLEQREMLAGDTAEIFGIVRNDLQGDGDASNDVVVVGASATLYQDGGDGVFGGDDTVIGSPVTTDANGRYQFDQLGAGRYFVRVALPPDAQFHPGENVREVVITPDEADGITGLTIDGFTTTQVAEAAPPLPSSAPSQLLDPNVLGGQRDLFVQLTESNNPISSVALASSGGNLFLASGPGATGNATVVWDGIDSSAEIVNPTGLGGIDLTQDDSGNTLTGIALTSGADHPNATITLRVYTDANNWSEFTTTVPESLGGLATEQAVFNFDDIPTAQAGSGANFTNVGALELTFQGVSAVDGQVSLIGLVGRATKQADFTASPRLSVGDHVWIDANDNGLRDPGEVGVAGVQLNLYQDTDLNNQYTSGVDALLGTTTTDDNGDYLFADLFPGRYLVQVAPANFLSTGPLAGLRSSLGNDPAPDPDNDQNNDDNGTPIAGAGVVSQAITLAGGTEPLTDGNSNSNRTVDFGFFGFDLVLDKEVEQGGIAPNETLNYTVTISNTGPSQAANTTFEDTLPEGVTFVSGTTDLAGVALSHSAGTITADLGTLVSGQVVTITIVATVNANATGTLLNTATVSAPEEVDLTNNTDTVSNPITPRIDLAIVKTDSTDPVAPGSTFSYTLDIVNNGPSDATGVIITDTLPPEGITFQSATQTPATVTDDQITFNIGNLASGATASVTIFVLVDATFAGELLNHSEVEGNEVETTLVNNIDTEFTLVQFQAASLAGSVFVDRNDNGVFETGETPIADVLVTLTGIDITGATVVRTATTATDGSYLFDNLNPGNYRLVETQPTRFRDGQDHIGTSGGVTGANPGILLIPNSVDPDQIQDLLLGIELQSGEEATRYDFGELATHGISKIDFIGNYNWR